MKCDSCPALRTSGYEYPEEYCCAGGDKECPTEWKDGSPGCKLHPATVKRRIRENDEAEARQYDGVLEWTIEQQRKEQAMLKAIDKELILYRFGALYLCFRDEAGRYYPISGDGMIFPELAGLIQMTYEKELEKSDA